MPAKKKDAAAKSMNKVEFIRTFAPDTNADEIVAKAKSQGLDLTKKYVWTKQSEMRKEGIAPAKEAAPAPKTSKRKGKKAGRKAAKAPQQPSSTAVASKPVARPTGGEAAQRMKALIVELGTVRADELYRDVRGQLDALVGA